jgi:hypothetical protein
MIEPGIYPNLSNADYHADKNSLSRTSIKDFYRNPFYYHAMHLNPDRPEKLATRDMTLGSAFHTLAVEPHLFDKEYAIEPSKVLLKDVGRDEYENYKKLCAELESTKKIVLTFEEVKTLNAMVIALERDKRVHSLMNGGEIEKSFFWKDEDSGLIVKARPDILHHNMIIDLKTIADASSTSFQRGMVDGWYHVQGAMIRDAVRILEGRTINTVINICVEKKYPYCVGIYIIDELALDYGERLYKETLLKIAESATNNEYKDYPVETIGLPKWAMGL